MSAKQIVTAHIGLMVRWITTITFVIGLVNELAVSPQAQLIMEEPWDGWGNPWHGFKGDINPVPSHFLNRTVETGRSIVIKPIRGKHESGMLFDTQQFNSDPRVRAASNFNTILRLQDQETAPRKLDRLEALMRARNAQIEQEFRHNEAIRRAAYERDVTPIGVPYSVEEAMMMDQQRAPLPRR